MTDDPAAEEHDIPPPAGARVDDALQGWLGLVGTGLVILVMVVLGNPGSGGIYPPEFLPSFFRSMHRWNPPGLGTELTRSLVCFGGRGGGYPLTGLAIRELGGLTACSPPSPCSTVPGAAEK